MVELADTQDLGSCGVKPVRVQISPSALKMKKRLIKIFDFLKAHKIAAVFGAIILLMAIFFVPKRVISYLKGPAEQYETAKVKKQDLVQTVSASGEIESENQVTLKFQTSGKLAWVGVKEGDRVEAWQAIASLDKRELKKNIETELNDYMKERWDFEQDRESYGVTADDLEKYTLTNEVRRILEKAQFDLNNAVIDVEIADLTEKLATLITPISGIVTEIESPIAGVNITPATANFTVADPSIMKFVANIDEGDIGEVRMGQKAIITLDAYPDEELEGAVTYISFASITTRGGGTAFPVEISLPENENLRFKLGMNGDAEIITASESDVLTIPVEAIIEKGSKKFVQTIEGKKLKEIEVETGIESETKIQIISGLEEDQIVIAGEKK